MTYRIEAATERERILRCLNTLSPAAVEEFTGREPYHFHRIANPNNTLRIKLEEAAGLARAMIAKGHPDPFIALYKRARDNGDCEVPELGPNTLLRRTARINKEVGELDAAVLEAGEKIDKGELDRIISESQDVLLHSQKLVDDACKVREAMDRVVALRGAQP